MALPQRCFGRLQGHIGLIDGRRQEDSWQLINVGGDCTHYSSLRHCMRMYTSQAQKQLLEDKPMFVEANLVSKMGNK